MGTIQGFCARSHARANCAEVMPLLLAAPLDCVHQLHVGFPGFGRETGHMVAEVARIELGVLVDLAGQKARTQRAEGHKADAEFFKHRQGFIFRAAPEERILALESGHGLHGMSPADRVHPGFGQPKVLHLARLDQLPDCPGPHPR